MFLLLGDGDDIILPQASDSVDWEVELVVVIGKEGKHVKVFNISNNAFFAAISFSINSNSDLKQTSQNID